MSDLQPRLAQSDDIYERSRGYRWLALIAALMAWGFDGVEQGVYSIMTRTALMDLIPAIQPQVKELHELDALIKTAESIGQPQGLADLQVRAKVVRKQVDGPVSEKFGLSLAMWLWGAAVGGVVFGRLGDRFGRVRTMLLAVFTYSVFTGLALSTHWSHLIVCRFLGAVGLGGTWPLCVALVVETWPDRFRSVLAGSIGAAANVGFLIAATYSWLMSEWSWRWIIGMGFIVGLASLPVIFMVPEPAKWKRSREKKEKSSLGELFTPQYRRSTIVGSLLSTVALLGTWGAFLWLPTFIDSISGGYKGAKSEIMFYQSIGQISGGFLGGILAARLGNRKSFILLCVMAWVLVVSLFGFTKHYGAFAIFMGVAAAFPVTAFFGWLPKFLPELYPTRIRASGQGFSFNIGRILAGFGALGTGLLVGAFKGDYAKGAMVTASVYLLGLVVIWFAPDTKGKMVSDEEDRAATLGH